MRVGVSIADAIAGVFATCGILMALVHRQRTGQGQEVNVNLLDGLISMLTARASNFLESEILVPPVGNHLHDLGPAGTFETQDGHLNITAWPDETFRRLCAALNLGDLWTDPRFATPRERARHREALTDILNARLRLCPTTDWIGILHTQGVPCGPILQLDQVFQDPQVLANQMVVACEHPLGGRRRLLGIPVKLTATPGEIRTPAPALGQHTEEILTALGYSSLLLAQWRQEGVI
jgi:CoA:oxalate CoA-transferase